MIVKDEWTVFSNVILGKKMYIVGRKLNTNEVLHSGNVEYAPDMGYTEDREKALAVCEKLNGYLPKELQ